jgi:hypothetical protein
MGSVSEDDQMQTQSSLFPEGGLGINIKIWLESELLSIG